MRLLHTGDLHLDSAFCSLGARDAEAQRDRGRQLLRDIFECARNEKCDMILFAGDVFDSKAITEKTGECLCRLVEENDITVVLSPGNHDYYTHNSFYAKAQERLGSKLILFTSSELQTFDVDALGVRVFGYAFTSPVISQNPLSSAELPLDNGYLKIFCGHADLSSPISKYAPITVAELEALGASYCALGHVHNSAPFEDKDGKIRYCGFAQGRSFDEIGEGGVWIVDTDGERTECERRVLSSISFYYLDVSVGENSEKSAIEERIVSAIKAAAYPAGAHVRLTLQGSVDERTVVDVVASADELCERCGLEYLEIIDQTLPVFDGEYLDKDTTIRGELYRTLKGRLMSEDAEERRLATRALKIALYAIEGKNIFDLSE